MDYQIITDASADLGADFVEKENIHVIPMSYLLGDEEGVCAGTMTKAELKRYYDGVRDGRMTRTSQITPQHYEDFFRPFIERGEKILYISLSSGLSGTYNASLVAVGELKEEFPDAEIRCVDSLSATGGMTIQVEAAAKNRAAGMSLEENASWLEANRLRVCHWFMVDDLMYLKRNGRISPAVAFVGAALGMKPILRIEEDGTLTNFEKKRGQQAALERLVEHYAESSEKQKGERVFVLHTDNEEGAAFLEKAVKRLNPGAKVSNVMMGPIIGCHVGPGFCAIAHTGRRI